MQRCIVLPSPAWRQSGANCFAAAESNPVTDLGQGRQKVERDEQHGGGTQAVQEADGGEEDQVARQEEKQQDLQNNKWHTKCLQLLTRAMLAWVWPAAGSPQPR